MKVPYVRNKGGSFAFKRGAVGRSVMVVEAYRRV
jgi:hypothetical protein